jgi:hypothetical protein
MPEARRILARLPALLGAAVVALGAAQIIWNGSLGRLVPALHWHVKIPLGAVPANPPPLTWATLLDGAWQHQVAHSVGPGTLLYRMSVRWRSQIYYSVFGTTGGEEIGVGPGKQLFQWAYVHAYCSGSTAAMQAQAPDAAARLRQLQDRLAAEGRRKWQKTRRSSLPATLVRMAPTPPHVAPSGPRRWPTPACTMPTPSPRWSRRATAIRCRCSRAGAPIGTRWARRWGRRR